jgi:hypothetical protein
VCAAPGEFRAWQRISSQALQTTHTWRHAHEVAPLSRKRGAHAHHLCAQAGVAGKRAVAFFQRTCRRSRTCQHVLRRARASRRTHSSAPIWPLCKPTPARVKERHSVCCSGPGCHTRACNDVVSTLGRSKTQRCTRRHAT